MAVLPDAITNQLVASLIPERIAKSIDAAERADRVAAARDLSQRASTATDPVLRRAYKLKAQAILAAQPRARTEQQHRELVQKAAAAPNAMAAERYRAEARELVESLHPIAPRRTMVAKTATRSARRAPAAQRKDAGGKPVKIFDSRLRPLGVVGSHAIVRKAAKAGTKAPLQAVFDQDGELIGVVDPAQIQPVAGHGQQARQQAQSPSPSKSLSEIQADHAAQFPDEAALNGNQAAVAKMMAAQTILQAARNRTANRGGQSRSR